MSKERIKDFIDKQLENLEDTVYKIEEDKNHIYAIFTEILSENANIEITFKLLDGVLYMHSITYGWKPVEKGVANKYFWIELLKTEA
jgi:ABC-type transporter MlaC component